MSLPQRPVTQATARPVVVQHPGAPASVSATNRTATATVPTPGQPVARLVARPATSPVAAKTSVPSPSPSLTASVSRAVGSSIRVPSSVILGNTNDLGKKWFRVCLYSETDGRKTSTAAQFGTPEEVRIVLTRRKEQLTPLEDLTLEGYQFAEVSDEEGLIVCTTHPEAVWNDPTWVKNPNRTLIVDDMTEGVNILLAGNGTINGKVVKNRMRTYDAAGKALRDLVRVSFRAPQHVILTALAKVKENPITNAERVAPELPPSMQSMLLTELEYVFYIKKNLWRIFTTSKYETSTKTIDGKEEDYQRETFAKNKLALAYKGANILGVDEPMDLRAIWNKILNAKETAIKKGAVRK